MYVCALMFHLLISTKPVDDLKQRDHQDIMNYGSPVLLLGIGCFFSVLILYTVGRTPWMGDQPVARPVPTQNTIQTSMS
jgi:hypothetical protein